MITLNKISYKLILIFFIVFASNLFSKTLDISKHTDINSFEYITYTKDDNYKIDNLDYSKFKSLPKAHLGNTTGPFWTKLEITNSSDKQVNIVLFNELAGINNIDVYLFKNNKLIKKHNLGDFVPQENIEFLTRYPSFNLKIDSNEKYTIISRVENYSIYNLSWRIKDFNNFSLDELNRFLKFGLLIGLGIFFIVLNFLNYYTYKNKMYILLAAITLSLLLYQTGFHGLLYYLDFGMNLSLITTITWTSSVIGALFILLFAYNFFNMPKKYHKISISIKILIYMFIIVLIGTLYAQYIDESLFKYSWVLGVLVIISTLYLFILSIYFLIKKEISSGYYFVAEFIFLLALLLNTLGLFNYIEYKENYKYVIPFSHLISYIVYMFALNSRNRIKYQQLKNAKALLMEKYRFNSIEQAIGNITHQWKHPLTKIGTTFALLEVTFKHNKDNFDKIFIEKTESINNSINLMKKIIDEFSNNINNVSNKNDFLIKKTVLKCVDILDTPITLYNINVNINIKDEFKIKSDEYVLMNILLVFLNNSIDAFKSSSISHKDIDITFKEFDNKKVFIYKDNAGGIQLKNIDEVFNYLVSTKKNKDGKGIGLAIVKMLVEEKLNGSIEVENKDNGCEFTIKF